MIKRSTKKRAAPGLVQSGPAGSADLTVDAAMPTPKKAATKRAAKRAAPKAVDPIPPGYKVIEVAVGPNPDGLQQQAIDVQTLPAES